MAVSSSTGAGKTYLGAVLVFWFLDCWEGGQVVTMAPKQDQLTLHIWKEIGKLWDRFHRIRPEAQLDVLRIQMRDGFNDWGAVGFICGVSADEQVASRARGFHAKDMLFIVEETTGVHPAILAAVTLTCTAPHNLRLYFGNPDSQQDSLAKVSQEAGVLAVRASSYDHPNIVLEDATLIEGAISRARLEQWKKDLGEDSPLFQSRARGIAPAQASDALIRAEWIDRAMAKTEEQRAELRKGEAALGVDVANSVAGDLGSLAFGTGAECREIKAKPCPDANQFGRHDVWPLIESKMVQANRVGVDSVGVGVGTINELSRLGAYVVPLNGGEAFWEGYAKDEKFANLRAQMYWQARVDLQHDGIALPVDQSLKTDLLAPTWRTHNGKIHVESKEDLKKRLGRSPDRGDAFVYWNWIRQAQRAPTFATPSAPVAF